MRRSSNFAMSSVFHPSLNTCHVPRAKAVIGIKASLVCQFHQIVRILYFFGVPKMIKPAP